MLQLDRTPWPLCPRSFLKRMIAKAAAHGLRVVAAFENEFYLARVDNEGRFMPFDRSNCFSAIGMDTANPIIIDIVEALEKQNITVQQYYPELGPGQQELSMQHTDALRAADQQLVVRETVRGWPPAMASMPRSLPNHSLIKRGAAVISILASGIQPVARTC